MRTLTLAVVALVFSVAADPGHLQAQSMGTTQECSSDIGDWSVVARGKMSRERGLRPVQVIRMDTNGEILFAAREPKTESELREAGIQFRRSQLELLVDWDLMEFDTEADTYRTTVHLFGPEEIGMIRESIGESVTGLIEDLRPSLDSLDAYLQETGNGKNLFAVLYAYVLHGYAMEQFGQEIYAQPELTAARPFWNGYAWALCPPRSFPVGNTMMPVGAGRLFSVSSESVEGPDFQQLRALAEDLVDDLSVDDPGLADSLSGFGVTDDDGRLTIPVFQGPWASVLHDMAARIYGETTAIGASPEMATALGMATDAQAAMFIHYEVRYAVIDQLLNAGLLEAPIDFEDGSRNGPEDIGSLMFLIR